MIKKAIFTYVWFGTCIRYLQDAQGGFWIKKESFILFNLDAFFRYLVDLNLQVTPRLSQVQELRELTDIFRTAGDNDKLTDAQAETIRTLVSSIRKTVDAELEGFGAYVVTPKILDTEKLLNDIPSLLAPNMYATLPEIARYDLAEAGKAISFELPTAAAFHLLRATECVLKELYLTYIKQKRCRLLWGDMIDDLKKRRKFKDITLLSHLDHIRNSYRNPTQHPEKIYDIHEVQDLWSLCIESINRMGRHLGETAPLRNSAT